MRILNVNKLSGLVAVICLVAGTAQAALVYQDDFVADPSATFNVSTGSAGSYDMANQQVDYDHVQGTTRRYVNYNTSLFSSMQGYMKADISNFTGGPGVWIGFVDQAGHANNANYINTDVAMNGTYELVFNNTAASIPFNNGAGWSGSLASGTGLFSTDGGATSAALTFGNPDSGSNNVAVGNNLAGFGFANFGNATFFETSSFSLDSIAVYDAAVVPEPSSLLLGLLGLALYARRRSA